MTSVFEIERGETEIIPRNVRRAPRVDVNVEVGIDADTNFYVGFTENVSEGGLFVSTYQLRPVGTEVALTFTLPGSDHVVSVHGVVRWIRDPHNLEGDVSPGMGIEFVFMKPEDSAFIDEYIRTRTPLFYPD